FAMAVGVGFADFLYGAFFPDGAFRDDDQSVVTGIVTFVVGQNFRDAIDIEGIFGNQTAGGSDVGGIKGGEAGIAAEDAENADAFVRAECGALAGDGFLGASDGGGEADAVFGALHIVVHGFRNSDDGHAGGGECGGKAERVVSADGDQAAHAEPVKIFKNDGCEIVVLAVKR